MNHKRTVSRRIGLIGIGKMGWPMAKRLVQGGHALMVYDAQPGRAAAFRAEHPSVGAPTSVKEMAADCDILITMLPDSRAVEAVLIGPGDCALATLRPDAIVLEMSSGEPQVTRRLAAQLAQRGVRTADAPVSGGVARAVTGQLSIMVGGDAAVVDEVRDVLAAMGASIHHVGPVGAGQAIKAINNMVSAGGFLIAAEALQIGTRFGLEPACIVDVLNASSGRNNSTENKFKPFVLSRKFDSGFAIDLMVKDLGIAVGLAHGTVTPAPFSEACLELWRSAAQTLEPGADHTAMARAVEQWSNSGAAAAREERQ